MPVELAGPVATIRPSRAEYVHGNGMEFTRLEDGSYQVTVLWEPNEKLWRTPLSKRDIDRLAQWLSDSAITSDPERGQPTQPGTSGQRKDVVSRWNDTGEGQVSFWKREGGGLWVSLMAAGLRRSEVHLNREDAAIFTKWLGEPPT